MNITNKQFDTIQAALLLLPKLNKLTKEEENIVSSADNVMKELIEKKKKDNERISSYIADKRKTNKYYARTPYIKKGDR